MSWKRRKRRAKIERETNEEEEEGGRKRGESRREVAVRFLANLPRAPNNTSVTIRICGRKKEKE